MEWLPGLLMAILASLLLLTPLLLLLLCMGSLLGWRTAAGLVTCTGLMAGMALPNAREVFCAGKKQTRQQQQV